MIDVCHEDGEDAAALKRASAKLIVATITLCVACMLLLAIRRAGWLDEYWTVWHTDPANPLAVAYWTRWMHDTQHPPTFYALSWMLAPLTGPTLAVRRLVVNSLGLLPVFGTMLACRRNGSPALQMQPLLFALLMVSGPYFITYFAEHRSYFLGLVASSCLVATIRHLHLETAAGRRPLQRGLIIWLFVITPVALNLHYTLSLCMLTLLGAECLWQWTWGERRRAVLVASASIVAVTPLSANLAIALSLHRPVTVTNTALGAGWTTIAFMLVVGIVVNVVLAVHASSAAVSLIRQPRRAAHDSRMTFFLLLAGVLLLLTIVFAFMHAITRNMYPRLLIGLIPLASAALAELAARRPPGRLILALACLNALAIAASTTVHELRNGRWEEEVPAILAERRTCPTTRIFAFNTMYLLPPDNPGWKMRGQSEAMALSYRMIARKYGFPIEVLPIDGQRLAAASTCPTLVWMEHNFFRPDLTKEELAARAGLGGNGEQMSLAHFDSHYLLRIEPAGGSPR